MTAISILYRGAKGSGGKEFGQLKNKLMHVVVRASSQKDWSKGKELALSKTRGSRNVEGSQDLPSGSRKGALSPSDRRKKL